MPTSDRAPRPRYPSSRYASGFVVFPGDGQRVAVSGERQILPVADFHTPDAHFLGFRRLSQEFDEPAVSRQSRRIIGVNHQSAADLAEAFLETAGVSENNGE